MIFPDSILTALAGMGVERGFLDVDAVEGHTIVANVKIEFSSTLLLGEVVREAILQLRERTRGTHPNVVITRFHYHDRQEPCHGCMVAIKDVNRL